MKPSARTLFIAAISLALFAIALAQNVTGAWKGKASVDTSKLPKMEGVDQKKMVDEIKSMLGKMTINLDLKANKNYAIKVTGLPNNTKDQTSEGTWKQSGKTITLTPTKENGKKPTGESAKPQNLTVSADGKKMTMPLPGGAMFGGVVTFTR